MRPPSSDADYTMHDSITIKADMHNNITIKADTNYTSRGPVHRVEVTTDDPLHRQSVAFATQEGGSINDVAEVVVAQLDILAANTRTKMREVGMALKSASTPTIVPLERVLEEVDPVNYANRRAANEVFLVRRSGCFVNLAAKPADRSLRRDDLQTTFSFSGFVASSGEFSSGFCGSRMEAIRRVADWLDGHEIDETPAGVATPRQMRIAVDKEIAHSIGEPVPGSRNPFMAAIESGAPDTAEWLLASALMAPLMNTDLELLDAGRSKVRRMRA